MIFENFEIFQKFYKILDFFNNFIKFSKGGHFG